MILYFQILNQLKIMCFMLSCFEGKKTNTHTHTHTTTWLTIPTIALFTTLALITAMARGQCPIGLEILFYNLRTLASSQCLRFPALS